MKSDKVYNLFFSFFFRGGIEPVLDLTLSDLDETFQKWCLITNAFVEKSKLAGFIEY